VHAPEGQHLAVARGEAGEGGLEVAQLGVALLDGRHGAVGRQVVHRDLEAAGAAGAQGEVAVAEDAE
jgi:hypothetical protein